ncbi:hypothetical protein [Klebsiella pneumoniae]|nr:hypothetical protein [Klebsiella pneumoniae]
MRKRVPASGIDADVHCLYDSDGTGNECADKLLHDILGKHH